jgi:hypothetical protein
LHVFDVPLLQLVDVFIWISDLEIIDVTVPEALDVLSVWIIAGGTSCSWFLNHWEFQMVVLVDHLLLDPFDIVLDCILLDICQAFACFDVDRFHL